MPAARADPWSAPLRRVRGVAREGFLRREVARHGVALILGFGDAMDVYEDEAGSAGADTRRVRGGQPVALSMTGVGGHQLGVQVELTPGGALALFGAVEDLNDAVVPLDEALGGGVHASWTGWPRCRRGRRAWICSMTTWAATNPSPRSRRRWHGSGASCSPATAGHAWSRSWTRRAGAGAGSPSGSGASWACPPSRTPRLVRFEHASALLGEPHADRTIADVAMAAGYYDQSHLTATSSRWRA